MGQSKQKIDHGKRVAKLFDDLGVRHFGVSSNDISQKRGRELWIAGIDEARSAYVHLNGDMGSQELLAINERGFRVADAGFKANLETEVDVGKKRADLLLLNVVHLKNSEAVLSPLLVHELCHFIEQANAMDLATIEDIDEANAVAILSMLAESILHLHTPEWAQLLAFCARRSVEQGSVNSINAFLEAAIPEYDRPFWKPEKITERSSIR